MPLAHKTRGRSPVPDPERPSPSPAPAQKRPPKRPTYNATVTSIADTGSGVRVFRVEPDEPIEGFEPGRYLSLGLGYWEPRYDGRQVPAPAGKEHRAVSRPYSISCPLVTDGRIHDRTDDSCLEFYIARVDTAPDQPPAELTPRLWALEAGDRALLGPRIVGRYTLDPVGPTDDVLLLATGTGEAPHNAMVNELAQRGHQGKVTSLTTSRWKEDFAYLSEHWALERLWSNYCYVPLPTRDPYDQVKRHVQDIITHPERALLLGFDLDPDRTHVFLCGNPSMVGVPKWDGDEPRFPPGGTLELLHQIGFTLDRKGAEPGNVHFEEYW